MFSQLEIMLTARNDLMQDLVYGVGRNRQKRFEALRTRVYWDNKENLTGGFGHNFTANGFPFDIRKRYVDLILSDQYPKCALRVKQNLTAYIMQVWY